MLCGDSYGGYPQNLICSYNIFMLPLFVCVDNFDVAIMFDDLSDLCLYGLVIIYTVIISIIFTHLA